VNAAARVGCYGDTPVAFVETLDDAAARAGELAVRLAVLAQSNDCHYLTNFALAFRQLAECMSDYSMEFVREGEGWDAL